MCFALLLIWAWHSVVVMVGEEKEEEEEEEEVGSGGGAWETIVIQTAKFKIQFMNPSPAFPTLMSYFSPPAKQSH